MKIALDEVESLLNMIEKIEIHENRKLIRVGAGIKVLYRGYKEDSKDKTFLNDARVDLFLIYEEDGEEYLTKLTQKVGYSTIKYTNSAFKVDDLYDATITIDVIEKWRLNKQIKDFIEEFKKEIFFSKVRYFTDKNSVNMLVEDISKLKEMTMFSRYTGEDMTKIEYMTNFVYYIEKEFGAVKTSEIDKYKMEEFENMDFIGWLIKSGEMGDYLEWRSEKTDLGGCIIQVDEGQINPKTFEKMLDNDNLRELNIKFKR
ncbi:hypothetical protein [Peptacetobacter hiranonis]|uniref:hypothetical protein n=1 Tax=Peptacetobacter hiranonis TaxID=89152 RepID=UPI0022E78D22|nr:hypothetical protein [Peptacetobacter hiranonis]